MDSQSYHPHHSSVPVGSEKVELPNDLAVGKRTVSSLGAFVANNIVQTLVTTLF